MKNMVVISWAQVVEADIVELVVDGQVIKDISKMESVIKPSSSTIIDDVISHVD